MKNLIALALGALLAWPVSAKAAPIEFKTVTVCGGTAYTVGSSAQATGLPTGEICNTLGGSSAVIGTVGIDQTTPGTTNGVSLDQLKGLTVDTGAGTGGSATQRTIIDSSQILTPGTAGTPSTQVLTVQGIIAGTPVPVTPGPTTSGGLSVTSWVSVNNATGINVKASAGQVYRSECFSDPSAATQVYLKLYNSASAPTCGSGTPVMRQMSTFGSTGGGFTSGTDSGTAFSSGIGYCLVTGITDADATAPAASKFICNIYWK